MQINYIRNVHCRHLTQLRCYNLEMNVDEKEIILFLQKTIPSLKAVYLFGSMASGNNTKDSDIDLAFLSTSVLPSIARFDIAQALAIKLNKDVDLVDLNEASEVMRFEVISKGERIFSDGSQETENFEDKTYMLYIDLNENRMGILDDIAKRGSVY